MVQHVTPLCRPTLYVNECLLLANETQQLLAYGDLTKTHILIIYVYAFMLGLWESHSIQKQDVLSRGQSKIILKAAEKERGIRKAILTPQNNMAMICLEQNR